MNNNHIVKMKYNMIYIPRYNFLVNSNNKHIEKHMKNMHKYKHIDKRQVCNSLQQLHKLYLHTVFHIHNYQFYNIHPNKHIFHNWHNIQ